MLGSLKTTVWLAAGCAIVMLLMVWHVRNLNAEIDALQGDLTDRTAEVRALESTVATSNAKVAEMADTAEALRENGRLARQQAQEAIKQHQVAIATIRREKAASCEPAAVRLKLVNELLEARP